MEIFMLLCIMWSHCIQSCQCFQQLAHLLIEMTTDQAVPHLFPPNRQQALDLTS
jgi:hypothetical protein